MQEKIEKAVKKLLSDKNLMAKFDKNPASVIEELIGVDLPDNMVNEAVAAIKAKIKLEQVGDAISGIAGLFGKNDSKKSSPRRGELFVVSRETS